ncbi:MAG: hypothetical protein RL653_262 [Pseudomonadota bacterium]
MAELNPRWADTWIRTLVQAGVEHAVICPGSRSAPLALACARAAGLRCWSVIDERSAGFFALGLGMATGRPALVVVTSGTAGAHLYPAVMEASLSHVPLIVLTADRPWELQGWGAAQTLPQAGLFGQFTRWSLELGAPEDVPSAFRHLAASAVRAVSSALGSPAGPVHVNLPFREPLAAQPEHSTTRESLSAPRLQRAPRVLDVGALEPVRAAVDASARGVILVGPHRPSEGWAEALSALSRATGYPLVAEAVSNARFGPAAERAVAHLDALWRVPAFAEAHAPDLVLRFGGGLTARNTLAFVERAGRVISFADDEALVDPTHAATDLLLGDCTSAAWALSRSVRRGDSAWTASWLEAEAKARATLGGLRETALSEPGVARAVFGALPAGANVVLASSMPIRDADAFAAATSRPLHVYSNRGANGIEGTVSTALGVAAGSGRPTWALVGDLAFLHDMGALLTAHRCQVPVGIVVVNNDGGGIFSFLPVAGTGAAFEPYFGTAHGLEFQGLASQFHAGYARVTEEAPLSDTVRAPLDGVRVVEARVPGRSENVSVHQAWFQAVRDALGSGP